MKNKIATFIFCLFPFFLQAQWSTSANDIYYTQGNVGIGTTNPSTSLDVRIGNTHGNIANFLSNGGISTPEELKWTISIGRSYDFPNRTLEFGMISESYGQKPAFFVAPEGNEVFRITETGNVGIGVQTPEGKLDVRGNFVLDPGTHPRLYTGTGSSELSRYLYLLNSPTNTSASGLKAGGILISDSYSYSDPGKNDLIVKGLVGIGVSSPNPSYKLTVNGIISASEVKVSSTPNSDYVFEPDYPLMSLLEVETFIKENKHLPEIPSAEEFKENGVGLGEMDDMLLRKVEELTLYVIEQNRRMEKLEMENFEQNQENENLKIELETIKSRLQNEN